MKLIANHTVHHEKGVAHAGESFDVTDRKEAERLIALGAARAAATEADKTKSDADKLDDRA